MPGFRISCPIRPQILPKHRITLDRLECDPHLRLPLPIALQKPTPPLPGRHFQPWEIRAAALAVRIKINHEGAEPVPAPCQRSSPVVVVTVVAGGIVALRPHALDVQVRAPALEGTGAIFQAADCIVTIQEGSVGEAFGWVYSFRLAIVDD